jgi:signal transduction histidine kinase
MCVREAVARAEVPERLCVEVEGLEALPPVMAGQHSLTMVFINLLENASNAMGGTGTVTIRGIEREEWVKVEIHDTGPGIDRQLQDQIFEFSFTGENPAQAEKLGFGLWWIKTLMARLGGSVSVESDGQHGTTFRLKFPRKREDGIQEGTL